MKTNDHIEFKRLKEAVGNTFLENHNAPPLMENWKGDDIAAFQEELRIKVKDTVSEKWFYTYIKNDPKKLPRIDMLNLLSSYVDFKNWNDFKNSNTASFSKFKKRERLKKYLWLLACLFAIILLVNKLNTQNAFHFCFVDETKRVPIRSYLDIKILKDTESPIFLKTDSLGCFSFVTKDNRIRFVVQSPYYKTDTIIRSIYANRSGTINLNTDDYALMLQYYSNGNVKDWKKRKAQLKKMIANDAQIYQVYPANIGIELYSKDDFINKLIVPTRSLNKIKILDKLYKDGKIVKLKFMIQ